jgi:two-component system sensor histidine kinase BaeS
MALIGMVFFMSIIFTAIALISTKALLGHAETYVQEAFGERLNQQLSIYYADNKGWGGVQDYVLKVMEPPDHKYGRPPRDPQRFLVCEWANGRTLLARSTSRRYEW